MREVEERCELHARAISAVEHGEHASSAETLRQLDAVLSFEAPLRSVLLSRERPRLWVPGELLSDSIRWCAGRIWCASGSGEARSQWRFRAS